MNGTYLLLILILFPIALAVLSYLTGRKKKKLRNAVVCVGTVLEFLMMLYAALLFTRNGILEFKIPQLCMMGLSLELDGFRVVFCIITSFMWMMTTLFSAEYMVHGRNRSRYYMFILFTLGAVMGVFLSADLFTTFIFFEVMSFTSYVWVAQEENPQALCAAGTYLAVAVIGGLVMLFGLILLYHLTGTLTISELKNACEAVSDKKSLYWAGLLILFGFGAKAGMFPLHIWLPKAHPVAPAPASALLSGILTKTGVFGILAISCNMFFHNSLWGLVILILGTLTMFLGALIAVFSINLKTTLALSSMSQIGFILIGVGLTCLLGEENSLAIRGTVLHMVNHSLIKLSLFMIAGVIAMNLHKLDLNDIRGFGKHKPFLKISFLMGALGIGGIPFWNGYVSKTLLHESIVEYIKLLETGAVETKIIAANAIYFFRGVEWLFLLTGGLTVAYMLKLFIAVFCESNLYHQKEMDVSNQTYMNRISAVVIGISSLILPILGFFPYLTMDQIARTAVSFFHGEEKFHTLTYLSFVNLKGAFISLTIGIVVYLFIIRRLMMSTDEKGNRIYVNCWPTWMDLEDTLYRPILLLLLPAAGRFFSEVLNHLLEITLSFLFPICTFFTRVMDYLLDSIIAAGRLTLWKDTKPQTLPPVGTVFTYRLGTAIDSLIKKTPGELPLEKTTAYRLTEKKLSAKRVADIIAHSMSFGLLLICFGLCLTLLYLLLRGDVI